MTDTSLTPVVSTVEEIRAQVSIWRRDGLRVGFVPTMGYLHEGHLSLIALALQHSDRVVVSIFVNPTQFGPNEDLALYPRDPEGDQNKVTEAGAHLIYQPEVETMYPPGAQTFVEVKDLTQALCGSSRPVHFQGVATVVTQLFNIVQPDLAVFGRKDFQQIATIRQMVRDLHIPVEILGGEIVREADGLAMSSRNVYLDPKQRVNARCLNESLRLARRLYSEGIRDANRLTEAVLQHITSTPGAELDYAELRDSTRLERVEGEAQDSDRFFVAVRFGKTRLIDNAPLALSCSLPE